MAVKLSKRKVEEAAKNSKSMRDMLLLLGLSVGSLNYVSYQAFLDNHDIDVSHWQYHHYEKRGKRGYKSLDEWMQKGTSINSSRLKEKILEAGLLKEECAICNMKPIWNNKKLVLVLDHINGDSKDNRKENLRLLCPNCNSQQPTFCRSITKRTPVLWECKGCKEHFVRRALNKSGLCMECRKAKLEQQKANISARLTCKCGSAKSRYSDKCAQCEIKIKEQNSKFIIAVEKLKKLVWEMPTEQIGKLYGVSGKAVEKRCKKFNIEKPPRGYWAKRLAGKIKPETRKLDISKPEARKLNISKEELRTLAWEMPQTKIAAKFGVSPALISKRCKEYSIKLPPPGYWGKVENR